MNVRTDTSLSTVPCPTLGRSSFKYLRLGYAAVSKSLSGTQTGVQSEESSSEKDEQRLYLSNASPAPLRVKIRAHEYV